jgi:hypothetical protein
MAEQVTADEPVVTTSATGGVEYRFPVEVEVRTTVAAADVDQAVQKALTQLTSAVRSA